MMVFTTNAPLLAKIQIANQMVFSALGTNVTLLKNGQQAIPYLADWVYEDWKFYDTSLTKERIVQSFTSRIESEGIPCTLVAFRENEPIGVISLREKREPEFHDYPQHSLWMGTLHVIPSERNKGLGTSLFQLALSLAKEYGYREIYTYLSNPGVVPWCIDRGAKIVESRLFHGHEITILRIPVQ